MVTSERGRQLIMDAEGVRLDAYLCPAGKWTIGVGHTGDVKQGDRITQHQAEVILQLDLERFEEAVTRLAPGLSSSRFSACVSFAFNVGIAAFEKSTLRRKILAGDFAGAAAEFPKWVRAGGKELPGLVKRRAAEQALFTSEVP